MNSREYLSTVSSLVASVDDREVDRLASLCIDAFHAGQTLFLLGNGGSAATASHLVADFQKCCMNGEGRPFPCLALTDSVPLLTAWANDFDYSRVFAEQLGALGRPGDVVIAISGSGNSPNVIAAVERANAKQMVTIGLAGYQGGKLKPAAQHCLVVPSTNMQQIEDVHMVVGHLIFSRVRDTLAGA